MDSIQLSYHILNSCTTGLCMRPDREKTMPIVLVLEWAFFLAGLYLSFFFSKLTLGYADTCLLERGPQSLEQEEQLRRPSCLLSLLFSFTEKKRLRESSFFQELARKPASGDSSLCRGVYQHSERVGRSCVARSRCRRLSE